MFSWLRPSNTGLDHISAEFGRMLDDGQQIFDQASDSLLRGIDPATVEKQIWTTDRRINATEQQIRRELVVHLTVAGGSDSHVCLRLMSLVKDAERIGDYCKNILEVAQRVPDFTSDPKCAELVEIKQRVSELMSGIKPLFEKGDEDGSRKFCVEAEVLLKRCDGQVDLLLEDPTVSDHPVAAALMFRYLKRVLAHATNIVSAIFMPIDKLDYFDERPEDRD